MIGWPTCLSTNIHAYLHTTKMVFLCISLQKCKQACSVYFVKRLAKIHRNRQLDKTRANIGSVFTRWRNLMEYLGFNRANELAEFLLDR